MPKPRQKITIYSDGGARGNPGPAGIGAVLYSQEGEIISRISEYIGETTNNQAEYRAILAAVKKAVSLGAGELECYLDSELVVKQLNREYKVKKPELMPLFLELYNLTVNIKACFRHIRRESNQEADKLVNQAIDDYLSKSR